MKSSGRTHINDYPEILREQAVLGELPPDMQRQIEASVGYAEFLHARSAENAVILAEYSAQEIIPKILSRSKPAQPNLSVVALPAFARYAMAIVPIAAVLLAVLLIVQPFRGIENADDITRIKGNSPETLNKLTAEQPSLEIWKQTGNQPQPLNSGAQVKAFDSLQIAYRAMGRGYGMIASIDGNAKMTLHYPEGFTASTQLRPGSAVVLPYAYQLDSAPRFERFFFITCRTEFKVAPLWSLIERQLGGKDVPANWAMDAALKLEPGFEVSSFLLRK